MLLQRIKDHIYLINRILEDTRDEDLIDVMLTEKDNMIIAMSEVINLGTCDEATTESLTKSFDEFQDAFFGYLCKFYRLSKDEFLNQLYA